MMTKYTKTVVLLMFACLAVGCTSAMPGSRRVFGPVDYNHAFVTSREVMGQYFSLAEADKGAGIIKSRPRFVEANQYHITDSPPGRETATLRLRRDGQYVVAYLAIVVQQEGSEAHRFVVAGEENYSGIPNQTPAELDAATTPEQNQVWQKLRYNRRLQRTILGDIAKALQASKAD